MLILRTCDKDGRSHGGFQWPQSGRVEAPDWNPEPVCGGGLHGLAEGNGDASLMSWAPDAVWIVAEVPEETGGDSSTMICRWYDLSKGRSRTAVFEDPESGVQYNFADGNFVRVES